MMKRSILIVVTLVLACSTTWSQQISDNAKVPFNPNILTGTLPSGIPYYILKNTMPANRIDLVMTVNAGAVLEDDDQNGLAHFCEHMAFNGTANFPKLELVNFLESTGIRFGADLNAYTNQDETVYMLTLPKVDQETIINGVRVLSDWASKVNYEEDDIDEERGVVMEEWRLRRGAEQRMNDAHAPYLYHGSKYAVRNVLGDTNVLRNAPYDAFRRFYRTWYQPGNMALIVVGDIDPVTMRDLLVKHFEMGGGAGAAVSNRPQITLPSHKETLINVATDKELTTASVELYVKRRADTALTYGDYRKNIIRSLAQQMLLSRLTELASKADPVLTRTWLGEFRLVRETSAFYATTTATDKNVLKAFNALMTEIERASRHGFRETELQRAKDQIMSQMESLYNDREKSESQGFAFELVRHVLTRELVPGVKHEVEIYRHYVPQITVEECQAALNAMLTDENRVITFSVPEGNGYTKPTVKQVEGLLAAIKSKDIAAYVDEVPTEPLMAQTPTPGTISMREKITEIDAEKLTLSNGATVFLKRTNFKNDEILMSVRSWGGQSLGPEADAATMDVAASLVDASGIAQFTNADLTKMLQGKNLSISPFISTYFHGFRGSSTPKDLQTWFELLHLYFTKPRLDADGYSSYVTQLKARLENQDQSPEAALFDSLTVVMSQHHPRSIPMSMERLPLIDTAKALAFFKQCFSSPSSFVFTFSGNFDEAEMDEFLKTYVASIPATPTKHEWRDVGIRNVAGTLEKLVEKGSDDKSWVVIVTHGPAAYTPKDRYDISAMGEVLSIRLREKLREEKSGVYFVGVQPSIENTPIQEYAVAIFFTCSPDRVDELTDDVYAEVDALKAKPIDESYIQKVKEIQSKEREVSMKKNNFWVGNISTLAATGEPFSVISQRDTFISRLTAEQVHASAKKYLGYKNKARFVLKPAK
jgi:zinc protease